MPQVMLDDELARYIEQQVATGRFRSASDVVRAGLALLDDDARRREEIRAELDSRAAHAGPWLGVDEAFSGLTGRRGA